MIANVIILGCGRSGTSIFGELFEGLGAHRYLFEPRLADLAQFDFSAGPVAMKVPKALPGAPMTPGLPFVLDDLLRLVPAPRVIFWQVRHPLDAVCSLRPGIETNWSHNPKPPEWEQLLSRPLVERCAHHWAYINGHGYRAVRDQCVVSSYESLVFDPAAAACRACEAAGIDAHERAAEIGSWVQRVGNRKAPDAYEAKHQTVWSRPDHAVRVERWRENLSAADLQAVIPIVAPAAAQFGYQIR